MDTANEIKKLRTDMGMNRKEFCDYYNMIWSPKAVVSVGDN